MYAPKRSNMRRAAPRSCVCVCVRVVCVFMCVCVCVCLCTRYVRHDAYRHGRTVAVCTCVCMYRCIRVYVSCPHLHLCVCDHVLFSANMCTQIHKWYAPCNGMSQIPLLLSLSLSPSHRRIIISTRTIVGEDRPPRVVPGMAGELHMPGLSPHPLSRPLVRSFSTMFGVS